VNDLVICLLTGCWTQWPNFQNRPKSHCPINNYSSVYDNQAYCTQSGCNNLMQSKSV